jgi:glyoxylate reductase
MKQGIVIINTARGAVIDESALVDALASGRVSSVGLDVFEHEPKIHPGLVKNEKVTLLPHMGTWTLETQTYMECLVVENVKSAVTEGKLGQRVGEQKDLPY